MSGDPHQQSNFVLAVGNTHDASLAGDIVVLLDDVSPAVRRAAAVSLGMLDTYEAASQLMARLGQAPSSAVRGAIAGSLMKWTTSTDAAMASIRATVGWSPTRTPA